MSITLTQAVAWFEEAEDLSRDSRAVAERCRDYYDHKQWTPQEAAMLRKRRQPMITRNRIKPKVDFLKGVELQTRTDPEAVPRTPADEECARVATDAVRFVYDQVRFPVIKSEVFENLTIEGTGGVEVFCKPGKRGDIDICIRHYQWDRLGWDPHSRKRDFSDSMYRYAIAWMDIEQAQGRYPGLEDVLSATFSREGSMSSTYDDAPRVRWSDAGRKRVRVVKLEFLHNGEVWVCEFTKGGFLRDPQPSPYVDDSDVPDWSILLQSSHVDRDGNRYGYVKPWLDVQDEINKRASKHLHLVSVRQTFSTEGVGNDVAKLKLELASPDGHLQFQRGEYGKDFGILPTNDQANAQFQLLQEAKGEIDAIGVNGALAGVEARDLSGNAIRRLQQGASTELKPLFEAIAQFDNQVCRAVWNRIRQFWTAEKWIRVTDDGNSPRWIGLNVPVTLADELREEFGGVPEWAANDPRLTVVTGVKNRINELDVHFTMVDVPDVVNAMQEQFEALTSIFPAVPEAQKAVAFEMLVEASTLRQKKKFLERMGGSDEQGRQAQAQAQAQLAETEQAAVQARLDLTRAQIHKVEQETELTHANKVSKMVEALYSAMQTGQVAVTVPGVVPVADGIARSAGYVDQDQPPLYPQPVPGTAMAAPPAPDNTSPLFPPRPHGPGEGMMHGIETARNDGAEPRQ